METCHQALVTQMAVVRIQSVALEDTEVTVFVQIPSGGWMGRKMRRGMGYPGAPEATRSARPVHHRWEEGACTSCKDGAGEIR